MSVCPSVIIFTVFRFCTDLYQHMFIRRIGCFPKTRLSGHLSLSQNTLNPDLVTSATDSIIPMLTCSCLRFPFFCLSFFAGLSAKMHDAHQPFDARSYLFSYVRDFRGIFSEDRMDEKVDSREEEFPRLQPANFSASSLLQIHIILCWILLGKITRSPGCLPRSTDGFLAFFRFLSD